MKRRELKKTINYLAGELMAECIAAMTYSKNVAKNDVENVALSILAMQNDLVSRLSHPEPGNKKLYFAKLRKDLIDRTDEIVEQIKTLI